MRRSRGGTCLLNEPKDQPYKYNEILPGAVYDITAQCQLRYGPTFVQCKRGSEVCTALWCKESPTAKRCSSFGPPADGTECAPNKWCYKGECIEVGVMPETVDGGWGDWGPWSKCSRTCGGGVEIRERICNNPQPKHLGRYCQGTRKEYTICNTQPCGHIAKYRQEQCEEFNKKEVDGKLHTWNAHLPAFNDPKRTRFDSRRVEQKMSVPLSEGNGNPREASTSLPFGAGVKRRTPLSVSPHTALFAPDTDSRGEVQRHPIVEIRVEFRVFSNPKWEYVLVRLAPLHPLAVSPDWEWGLNASFLLSLCKYGVGISADFCKLYCLNEEDSLHLLRPRVADGTRCHPGTKNTCIQGSCVSVGCDWKIESGAVEDICGVCNGDGTHCVAQNISYTKVESEGRTGGGPGFTIKTDHKSLVWVEGLKETSARGVTYKLTTIEDPTEQDHKTRGKKNHRGIRKTLANLRRRYYWLGMGRTVTSQLALCELRARDNYVRVPEEPPTNGSVKSACSIPKGATNVIVREAAPSKNYLLYISPERQFYVENTRGNPPGEYLFGEDVAVLSYPEMDQEEMYMKGPIKKDLRYAFAVSENVGLTCTFVTEIKVPKEEPSYRWEFLKWEPCTALCGTGSEVWKWGECSGCLNKKGERHRQVECIMESPTLGADEDIIVDPSQCCGTPPKKTESCTSSKPCDEKEKKKKRRTSDDIFESEFLKYNLNTSDLKDYEYRLFKRAELHTTVNPASSSKKTLFVDILPVENISLKVAEINKCEGQAMQLSEETYEDEGANIANEILTNVKTLKGKQAMEKYMQVAHLTTRVPHTKKSAGNTCN
ncbi:hypothetical protein AAG570_006557 [Ranatra chinensis]|uniref:Uncharacterized protein n=1 Tax=Ranatra chinensis TaxID=642074 RepID=A0ABD0YUC2_9HEMI